MYFEVADGVAAIETEKDVGATDVARDTTVETISNPLRLDAISCSNSCMYIHCNAKPRRENYHDRVRRKCTVPTIKLLNPDLTDNRRLF
ncbi:hypothetical protein WN55_01609 [Dufourea novaeangliae]|uniref:Uncharacterized protein n=1 Tax=Dufourea novaeangliae TaxID=178035 RepID=A0A154PI89_DUFNO|nr:hypothetical protein WN55_01609 [Dufourea novaeangliae]